MPPSSSANLKALGLNYSPNQLSVPDGSMIQADNVVVRRDNVVESRRGLRRYSESLGGSTDRAKQLIEYKNRILVHYNDKLAFDTEVENDDDRSIFDDFSGDYLETEPGLRIKSIEANKNLYFTTSEGIKKISAVTAADFTTQAGFIQNAGAVKALDVSAELELQQGQLAGFLPPDSAVAYRVVWGYKDANQNLLLGTPSNRAIVYNYLSDILTMDLNAFSDMLDKLDTTGSLITDGDYANTFYSPPGTLVITLQSNLISLANKLDLDIQYASVSGSTPLIVDTIDLTDNLVTINFSSGDPSQYILLNDWIELSGLDYSGSPFLDINGPHQVDFVVTSNSLSFTFTHVNIVSSTPTICNIFSDNYRNIIVTGDDEFPTPLGTLVVSTPPTSGEERVLQDTMRRFTDRIKSEPSGTIDPTLLSEYVTPFTLTENANAKVQITIPEDITAAYFVQVYRTRIFTATATQTLGGSGGNPVVPDDEMRQVAEIFPTDADIIAGILIFNDETPDELVQNNTNLYTNPETGEGLVNANEPPPFSTDINRFKNVTFYSNTRTKHSIPIFQLLGLSNIHSGDKITITNSVTSDTYTFVTGVTEQTTVTYTAGATVTSGMYYELFTGGLAPSHYIFWQRVDGVGSAPVVTDPDAIYILVDILSTDTNSEVATKNKSAINIQIFDFTAEDATLPSILITNEQEGKANDGTAGTSPFTVVTTRQGDGEDAANKQVLLSSLVSAAQAIEETAISLVRVINKQADSAVVAYYVSGDTTPPGQINLQSKNLNDDPFYIIGSTSGVGGSFNPDISSEFTNITAISMANPTVITFSAPHNLQNGDKIIITGSNSTPSIDGERVVTRITSTTISIPVNVTVAGTSAVWSTTSDATVSTNEIKPNRVYYSKLNQPEAVPLLNFFDISAEDKAILRIFPLRDTLFAFKEDGTYRISGQVAPFVTALLDSSCIVIAPDSVAVSNNIIYAWTSKGITPISEAGASTEVSRPIDTEIIRLASRSFPNFSTLTWGLGYDSDDSYTVYTNTDASDTAATIGFRYCTLTNTWTNTIRTQTCGAIMPGIDVMYLGSGTKNIIDQERKFILRTDYADDDFFLTLRGNAISPEGLTLQFTSVNDISIGDVITQDQTLTIYGFNALLDQLDKDPGLHGGYAVLSASPGDSMRNKVVSLAQKLDTDSGTVFKDYFDRIDSKTGNVLSNSINNPTVITSDIIHELIPGRIVTIAGGGNGSIPSIKGTFAVSNTGNFATSTTFSVPVDVITEGSTGLVYSTATNLTSFDDIQACFNEITSRLNADPGVLFNRYPSITNTTLFEAVVLSIDYIKNKVTMNLPLQWIIGNMTVYQAIPCEWTYSPCILGDPLSTKQMFDATFMFRDRAFTGFIGSFSSDLFPEFVPVNFRGMGNGIFGHYSDPGFGYSYFGGGGNSAPFRTYIPMNSQRCRYINTKITHMIARELFALYGITLTGEVSKSFRGYR